MSDDRARRARRAAYALWSALTPEERTAGTAAATAAAAEQRRAEREDRETEARARALAVVHGAPAHVLVRAIRLVGEDDPQRLARQVHLLNAAEEADHAALEAAYLEGETDAHRRHRNEEGAERANARPQEAEGHRPHQGTDDE